jgi:actin-related protein 6
VGQVAEQPMTPFVEADPGTPSQINPQDTPLVVTEPVFNLPNVQDHYDQIIFEEYESHSYLRCPGALSGLADVGAFIARRPEC